MFSSHRTGTFCGLDGFVLLIFIIVAIVVIAVVAAPFVQDVLRELSPLLNAAQLAQP
jgi:hypothetical protein